MKKIAWAFTMLMIVLMSGCGEKTILDTPTKKVEAFFANYQTLDEDVLTQLDDTIDNDDTLSEDQKVEHGCNSSVYYYPANGYDVEYVRYGTSNSNLTDTPIDILKVFENVQSNYYFHVSYKITDTKKSEITKSTYNWIDLKL